MELKAGLQILQQAGKVATGYADDAVGIFCRKPVTVNPAELKGLRFVPEVLRDTYIQRTSLSVSDFFEDLVNKGLKQFNNPKLKQAYIEKLKNSGITLEDLKRIITELYSSDKKKDLSQTFINLTNPIKSEFVFNGVKLPRPLDFKEAEFVLKKNYTPEEISEFILRKGTMQIDFENLDIIVKNKIPQDNLEHFLLLKRQHNFNPQEALYATYLKDEEIQVFKTLINEHALTKEEAVVSILNKFSTEQNKVMQSLIKKFNINPQEAGLCTKLELNESEISNFLKLKNKKIIYQNQNGSNLEYILSSEEAIYCAKEGLNETQVERYVKLKNQYFAQETVRNSGAETNYSIKDILGWVKNGASDEEVYYYNYFLHNCSDVINSPLSSYERNCLEPKTCFEILEHAKSLQDQDVFAACKQFLKNKSQAHLSNQEDIFIKKILNSSYSSNSGYETLNEIKLFYDYRIQTVEQMSIFNELQKASVGEGLAGYIANVPGLYEQIIQLTSSQKDLEILDLAILAMKVDLKKFNITPIVNKFSDKFYKICTGEKEKTIKIFDLAQDLLQKNKEFNSNLDIEDITNISKLGINKNSLYKNLRLDESNNLVFNCGKESFNVAIKKINIDETQVLAIKDLSKKDYYIAYNGAIKKLNSDSEIDKKTLEKSFLLFSEYFKKQNEIYAQAAKNFPIKIIDNNSKCIIGQGISELNIVNTSRFVSDNFLTKYYQYALKTLKNNDALTAQNILRIMPQGSNIQINPYTTSKNGKMLYSISAEWKSSDGIKWQLRTHSTDLEHYMNSGNNAENSDWIFRLGHEVNGEMKFFEFNDMTKSFEDTGYFLGKSSHIQIPQSPFEGDNLLGNIHFQNIIRQISTKINENESVECLAKELGLNPNGKDLKRRIVEESFNNPLFYIKYKEEINLLRSELGINI